MAEAGSVQSEHSAAERAKGRDACDSRVICTQCKQCEVHHVNKGRCNVGRCCQYDPPEQSRELWTLDITGRILSDVEDLRNVTCMVVSDWWIAWDATRRRVGKGEHPETIMPRPASV